MIRRFSVFALVLIGMIGSGIWAAEPGPLLRTASAGPMDLRGYGRVSAAGSLYLAPAGRVGHVVFSTAGEAAAALLAKKYLTDLQAYGPVTPAPALAGIGGTVLQVRHGGDWLIAVAGAEVHVVAAPERDTLTTAAGGWATPVWQPVPDAEYPRFLDCFDNGALGMWWMPTTKSEEIMDYMHTHPMKINMHTQRLGDSPAPGVYDSSMTDNALVQIHELDKPYRFMLWSGLPDWLQWGDEHHVSRTADGHTDRRLFEAGGYYSTQNASPLINRVQQTAMIELMRRYGDNPNVMGWMEPHGEFSLQDPPKLPPGYQHRFPAYLQLEKHYSLASLGEAWHGDRDAFPSWDDVPYPDLAFFEGRRGAFIDLDDQLWRWERGEQEAGVAAGWHQPAFDDGGWRANRRDSITMLSNFEHPRRVCPLWMRFTQEVPADFVAGDDPVYLNIMPYTEREGRTVSVWINGAEVARDRRDSNGSWRSDHIQIDVKDALRPGANHFVIYSHGGRIAYRVFLNRIEKQSYPFSDPHLSQFWLDWREYLIWEKLSVLETYLQTMRSADPNRPIKVMTPWMFQSEAMALFEKYGAYPQLTGEGSWYRPMHYKGYSALRRLPGSSEPGGPVKDARGAQRLFAMIFYESQDAHDYVFDAARDFWPYEDVVQWWRDNIPLLETLGKTDFADFQLGVLRDTRQPVRYANGKIWEWDLARGPLPSAGLAPVLVDGGEFERNLGHELPVIVDCATIVTPTSTVDAIERYVAGGGTFVAQHHTGRHTPIYRDTWPLAARFGLKIEPKHITPENYHKWPLGKIRFAENQQLMPALRGREVEGSGVSIDWMDRVDTGAIGITSESPEARPIAYWEDGSMAVVEVRRGRGRFILLGTPFYVRMRDKNGRWVNEDDRQALLEELLYGLGLERRTESSDGGVWFQHRESKNGLYDIWFAGRLGIRGDEWQLADTVPSHLRVRASGPVVEPSAPGVPQVAARAAGEWLDLGEQTFEPYQIRQFATLRPDVALDGPLHWLKVQWRHWRALEPAPASRAQGIVDSFGVWPARMGQAGLDLSHGWRAQIDPPDPDATDWTAVDFADGHWAACDLGSFTRQGWPEAKRGRYRKTVTIPEDWAGGRVLFGIAGDHRLGICDTGRLWIDGEPAGVDERFKRGGFFRFDVTDAAADGSLTVAFDVTGEGLPKGPVATLFLYRLPPPSTTMDLNGTWQRVVEWGRVDGTIELPVELPRNDQVFALRRDLDIPAEWAGRPVYLVIDHPEASRHSQITAAVLNDKGYAWRVEFSVPGVRVDRWLRPGEVNRLELHGYGHQRPDHAGTSLHIDGIRLEVH